MPSRLPNFYRFSAACGVLGSSCERDSVQKVVAGLRLGPGTSDGFDDPRMIMLVYAAVQRENGALERL